MMPAMDLTVLSVIPPPTFIGTLASGDASCLLFPGDGTTIVTEPATATLHVKAAEPDAPVLTVPMSPDAPEAETYLRFTGKSKAGGR